MKMKMKMKMRGMHVDVVSVIVLIISIIIQSLVMELCDRLVIVYNCSLRSLPINLRMSSNFHYLLLVALMIYLCE